jgi:hypothetical protein
MEESEHPVNRRRVGIERTFPLSQVSRDSLCSRYTINALAGRGKLNNAYGAVNFYGEP